MRILFLSFRIPVHNQPSGETLRLENQVRELTRRGHEVHVMCLKGPDQPDPLVPQLERLVGTPVFALNRKRPSFGFRFSHLLAHASPRHRGVSWCDGLRDETFAFHLRKRFRALRPDVVHIDAYAMGTYAQDLPIGTPTVWFVMDNHALTLERNGNAKSHHLGECEGFESRVLQRVSSLLCVAEPDRQRFLRSHPHADVRVAPNGIDPASWLRSLVERDACPTVVFVGNMNAPHNVAAAVHYAKSIHPLVQRAIPNVQYDIVGANPALAVRRLASDSIRIIGKVDHVKPYLAHSHAFAASMVSGSGMLNKLQEAACMELPIVATSIAADGLALTAGKHALVADDPHNFASHVVSILRNPSAVASMVFRARKHMLDNFTWTSHGSTLEEAYEDAIRSSLGKRQSAA